MRLNDIRNLIQQSTNDDWQHIGCWGAGTGPSFHDAWGKTTGPGGWELDHDSHSQLLIYREDVQLSVAWGLGLHGKRDEMSPEWLDHFPMVDTVEYFAADIFWNGSLVDRHDMVAVDGGRIYLPLPRPMYWASDDQPTLAGWQVGRWHTDFARLLHNVEHVYDFDEALKRARFEVVD